MKIFKRVEPSDVVVVGDKFKRETVVKRFETEDGLRHEFTTFYAEQAKSVAIFALTDDDRVIVVREFRPGPQKALFQLPSGAIEQNETPEEAARRELEEETGYRCDKIEYLGQSNDDGYVNVKQHVFFAANCHSVGMKTSEDVLENEQGIELHVMRVDQLLDKAANGDTCYNGSLLMGYLKYRHARGEI